MLALVSARASADPPRPPSPSTFRVGSHADRANQGGALAQPGSEKFEGMDPDGYDDVENALQEICPCLFIRVVSPSVHRDARGRAQLGEIIVRHPEDVRDLDRQLTRRREGDPAESNRRNFCDCYSKHRAGCNLIWLMATGGQPVTIWEVETDEDDESKEGNVHRQGHVGFHLGSRRGGEREGTSTRRPRSVGLAHELAHASHFIGGSPPPTRMEREFKASRAENQIRRELREAEEAKRSPNRDLLQQLRPRTHYDGQPIPDRDGIDIPVTDFFECDKKAAIAPPPDNDGANGNASGDDDEIGMCDPGTQLLAQRPAAMLDATSAAILDYHNRLRAEVGSPPLRWNPQLAEHAAQYAVVLAGGGTLEHASREGRKNERENIALSRRGANSPMRMARNWGDEKAHFRGGIFPNACNGDWSRCGHFTQMVWSTTTDIGCGFHRGREFDALVCRYSPPGNRDGKPVISNVAVGKASRPCPPEEKARTGRPQ